MPFARIEIAKKQLRREIGDREAKIVRLEKIEKMMKTLPETCPSCEGRGEERYTDAADSTNWRDCKTCRGLGKIGDIKCECGNVITTDMIQVRRESIPKCPWCGYVLGDQYMWF